MSVVETGQRGVLITGAARRIGAAMARALAADGWRVVVHYHQSEDDAASLAAEINAEGGTCAIVPGDLACQADVETLVARAIAVSGPLDCLVNNASRFVYDNWRSVSWESLHAHLLPNLMAPVILCRDFAAALGGREGNIVNLLDQKIENLTPDFYSYTLSKIALAGLTDILARSHAGQIRVNAIAPGLTMISTKQTPESFDHAWRATPSGRSSTPEELVAALRFILATPSLVGETIFLDGGERMTGRPRDVAFLKS